MNVDAGIAEHLQDGQRAVAGVGHGDPVEQGGAAMQGDQFATGPGAGLRLGGAVLERPQPSRPYRLGRREDQPGLPARRHRYGRDQPVRVPRRPGVQGLAVLRGVVGEHAMGARRQLGRPAGPQLQRAPRPQPGCRVHAGQRVDVGQERAGPGGRLLGAQAHGVRQFGARGAVRTGREEGEERPDRGGREHGVARARVLPRPSCRQGVRRRDRGTLRRHPAPRSPVSARVRCAFAQQFAAVR
ncbi:hypothetical protein GCM10010326_30230 [Streptomyces xanthochromogenes]|uniref:Uncharacterized protein n=1 Tax=Streptomyces xanthochromogenes TaxID=67384 RepID=A0ABQ3A3F3_9ACTN|nr:hypothetical protein GCM10010326_30230 [Streptomyces xanthochromogenes]